MAQVDPLPRSAAVILIVVSMMWNTGCKPSNDDAFSRGSTRSVDIGKSAVSEGTAPRVVPAVHGDRGNDDVLSEGRTRSVNIGKSTVSEDTALRMVPVVHVDRDSKMNVQFYTVNQSSKPAGYWTSWPRRPHTWHWELVSCRTGTAIERARATSAEPTKEDVRLLVPGESILCSIDLKDFFGDIPVGLYEFRVHYSIHENDTFARLGCVPDEFDCTIMLVEVAE